MATQMVTVDIINESTITDDAALEKMMAGFAAQVHEDFAPAWGVDTTLNFFKRGTAAQSNPKNYQLIILDDSDQADALGYHELTEQGQALGKVFAKSDQECGSSLSVTISHELLEMLADPLTTRLVTDSTGNSYIVEVCDAVEADEYGYEKAGTLVSDWNLPAFFGYDKGTQYDFCKKLNGSFPNMLPGGYLALCDKNGNWTQITAQLAPNQKDSKRRERGFRTKMRIACDSKHPFHSEARGYTGEKRKSTARYNPQSN